MMITTLSLNYVSYNESISSIDLEWHPDSSFGDEKQKNIERRKAKRNISAARVHSHKTMVPAAFEADRDIAAASWLLRRRCRQKVVR